MQEKKIAKILNTFKDDYREILNLPHRYITYKQSNKAFACLSIFIQEHLFIPKGNKDQSETEEQLNTKNTAQCKKYYPRA